MPAQVENDPNYRQARLPHLRIQKCEVMAAQYEADHLHNISGAPVASQCFDGSRSPGMTDYEFEYLTNFRNYYNSTKAAVRMVHLQAVYDEQNNEVYPVTHLERIHYYPLIMPG